MWHIILILFVIPVAVWILSSLFRAVEEQQRPQQRPRPGGPRPGLPQARRPSNDIETFLEEINRRRREGMAKQGGTKAPTGPAVPPRAVPRPKPAVRPVPSAIPTAAVGLPRREAVARRTAQGEVIDVVVAEVAPAALPADKVVEVVAVSPEAAPFVHQVTAPATRIVRQATPNLAALADFIRSPQTLRGALLFQQVLAPPLCHRRRPGRP